MKHRIDMCQNLATYRAESDVPTFCLGILYSQATGEHINHKLMSQSEREGSAHYFDLYEVPFSM